MGDEGKPPAPLQPGKLGEGERFPALPACSVARGSPDPQEQAGEEAVSLGVLRQGSSDSTFSKRLPFAAHLHGLRVQIRHCWLFSHVTPDTCPSPVSREANPQNQWIEAENQDSVRPGLISPNS